MLLREVEYAKPGSVAEALELLASNDGARALAGGQTLINVMKARAASPDMLVDLNGLEELRGIELAGDGTLTIGAMTTYTELMASAEAKARPILGEVCATIAADGTCIANAAASVNGAVRVALGCVDAVPVVVTADAPEGVADAVRGANLMPPSDVHASSEYRTHLAEVLATRAAEEAAGR